MPTCNYLQKYVMVKYFVQLYNYATKTLHLIENELDNFYNILKCLIVSLWTNFTNDTEHEHHICTYCTKLSSCHCHHRK